MSATFEEDQEIGRLFEAYSLDCIDLAKTNFNLELAVTDESVQLIEQIAGQLHDSLPPEGVPAEMLDQFVKMLGSHVANVLVNVHDWKPGMARFEGEGEIPGVELPGQNMCWPWARVHKRLLEGPEENIWHYYLALTDRL